MPEECASNNAAYECAHCKLVCIGSPVEIVIVDNNELSMCCLGCFYAADMLLGLQDTQTQ
jgi:hypothetical protein